MNEHFIPNPPSRRRLLAMLAGACLFSIALLVGIILPAEFHLDPLGTGKLTGLLRLSSPAAGGEQRAASAPPQDSARFYPASFRNDTVAITLAPGGTRGKDELEWKVRMQAGQTLVYSWTANAADDEFYFDFHGQSDPKPGVLVQRYLAGMGAQSHGTVVAPFDGIHGWYLQNQTDHPVVVQLKLSGFYTMRADPTDVK